MTGITTRLPPWVWYGIGVAAMIAVVGLSRVLFADAGPLAALLAGVFTCLAFVAIGWIRSDEATKEARKVAWWHGGNLGLLAAVLTVVSLPLLPQLRELIVNTAGAMVLMRSSHTATSGFALGVAFVALLQFGAYLLIWTGWWMAKR